jgi:hypothetical protein
LIEGENSMLSVRKVTFVVAIAAGLAACQTPYGEMGFLGGVEATRLDEHRVAITARGNGYTTLDTTQQYVMRKAAEETTKAGYTTFEIVASNGGMNIENVSTAGGTTTIATKKVVYSAYTPAETYSIAKPEVRIEITMTNDPPSNANMHLAAAVLRSLAPAAPAPASSTPSTGPTAPRQ